MRRPPTDRPGFGHIASVLRHRNYRLLWSGLMVSNSGDWMDQVALNWLVLQTTGSAFYLGLVNLFRAVPILALTLLGGVAADRFERRRLMMVSQSVGMVLAIILALLVYQGQAHIWVILAIAAGRGAVVAFNQPARQTLISEIVPQSILPSAIALNALTMNLTKVIGPLLAGLIIANLGMAACFAVNAASFLAVLYTLHSMEFPPRAARPEPEPVLVSLMSGFRYLWDNQTVLILVLVAIIPTFFGQPYLYLLALFAVEIYHVGAEGVGLMTASLCGTSRELHVVGDADAGPADLPLCDDGQLFAGVLPARRYRGQPGDVQCVQQHPVADQRARPCAWSRAERSVSQQGDGAAGHRRCGVSGRTDGRSRCIGPFKRGRGDFCHRRSGSGAFHPQAQDVTHPPLAARVHSTRIGA